MATLSRPDVTDTELSVMQSLWDQGSSTIRELTVRLYPGGGTAHYATVQKLLERLAAKGYVRRRRRGRLHVYASAADREAVIARRLHDMADKLCQGSMTPLLTHLVNASELSTTDLAALRELVDRLHDDKGSTGR